MIPVRFDYECPGSLDDALALLAKRNGAAVIAGGQSLIPAMTTRRQAPTVLIDIRRIGELGGISSLPDGGIRIGAATTLDQIASAADVRARFTALAEAAEVAGDPAVRHRGTIGGALGAGHPAGDVIAAVIALGGSVNATSRRATRAIAAQDFVTAPHTTTLKAGELITSVDLPAPGKRTGSAYVKVRNPGSGYAICAVAAAVTLDADGPIRDARLAVTGAADRPVRLEAAELAIRGGTAPGATGSIGPAVHDARLDWTTDVAASGEYRRHLAEVLARRAINLAAQRGGSA
jgi:carbon-monoxide dehydrogenase medium subunit